MLILEELIAAAAVAFAESFAYDLGLDAKLNREACCASHPGVVAA